jgi:glycosyltransferase involved in cell wall biosynthesis
MPPITAILITYNEEADLSQSLESLRGMADEIVVVDSGSTDRTIEVARGAGARVEIRPFTNFAEQKNFAASLATHNWVLSLDADEALSPELKSALLEWKKCMPGSSGYKLARRTYYLGGWIRHSGWYPDYAIRLYRRDRAGFAGALHETVQTGDPVGCLRGDLLHYTVRSLPEHYAKIDVFTTRAAQDLYARGRRRWRGGKWIAAPWTLLHKFVFQLGFLDGYRGAVISWTSARYVWMKYSKLGVLVRGGTLQNQAWPQAGDA